MLDSTDRIAIIGYGRAGKRHANILYYGLGVNSFFIYDPVVHPGETRNLAQYLRDFEINIAVVCTPPDLHLELVEICLDAGCRVFCEKPLCGLGQIERARTLLARCQRTGEMVRVAYNYRFHPKLKDQEGKAIFAIQDCLQYRELPPWGLLLDHVSHDLDILAWVKGKYPKIQGATHYAPNNGNEGWVIRLDQGMIVEVVSSYSHTQRQATLYWKGMQDARRIEIDPDPRMYVNMWRAFLAGEETPDLEHAVRIQEQLEECQRLAHKGKKGQLPPVEPVACKSGR